MKLKLTLKLTLPLLGALAYAPNPAWAALLLADLASFAVLGATGVTNVATSTIGGNLGSAPTASVGGGYVFSSGSLESNTTIAQDAQLDLTIARTNFGLLGPGTLLPADLAGLTLTPGVYTVPAGSTNLSGIVILDGLGNSNAFWLFQMPSTLITSPGSVVNVINAGSGAGLFWNVGSSATLDTTTSFEGNILALTSVGLNTFATIGCGRALADNGAVTLDQNTINADTCAAGTGGAGSNGFSGSGLDFVGSTVVETATPTVVVSVPGRVIPEPGTLALLGFGLAGLLGSRKKSPTVA